MIKKMMLLTAMAYSFAQVPVSAQSTETSQIEQLQARADNGDTNAQTALGMFYIDGDGVVQDIEKGVALLQSAAETGNQFAQAALGIAYLSGEKGLPKDATEGKKWLEKAAAQGNETAIFVLQDLAKEQ